MMPSYSIVRHLEVLAEYLEAVESGHIQRLMVEMPPRHGKSQMTSIFFPAWYLGLHPDREVILTSYAATLAERFSRQARNLFADVYFPFPARIAEDQRSSHAWAIDGARGGLVSAGVGGPVTGHGANLLLIDDPVKNAEEADSDTYRESVWEWYRTTAYTRLERPGAIVLTMTRWHDDDLAGRLLREAKRGGEHWTVLRFPARAEEQDALGRSIGAPLWPQKYDDADLTAIERTAGPRNWQALFQQSPVPAGGNIFRAEWWQSYPRNYGPQLQKVIQSWDTAFKDGDENDESACWTAGIGTDGRVYVLDVWHGRTTSAALIGSQERPGIIAQHYAWFAQQGLTPAEVVIEDKGSGTTSVQMLALSNPYLPIVPQLPRGSKTERARAVTPFYEAGRILHPDGLPWVEEFQLQCERFPTGTHDDMVDAMTQGLPRLLLPPTELLEMPAMPRVRLS